MVQGVLMVQNVLINGPGCLIYMAQGELMVHGVVLYGSGCANGSKHV